jgi:hypothetical protein
VNLDSLRLEPGSHRSPRDGVCLLELTSILAEEDFSDRPRCVCKVIAAFLRSWNDRSSHAERQRLLPYAKRVIGSKPAAPVPDGRQGLVSRALAFRARSSSRRSVTRRRRDICLIWGGADLSGGTLSRAIRRVGMRLRILALCGIRPALRLNEGAGELAARMVFARYDSRAGIQLVDMLLEVGTELEGEPRAGAPDGDALARAVVERALRDPAPLPPVAESSNGNGNGNGHRGEAPRRVAESTE